MSVRIRIWDLPTRLFHWLLAAAVLGSAITSETGPIDWHARFGYAVLALLGFRVLWGFAGGWWSRFSSFIYSPASVWRHLQGRSPAAHLAGHSPLAALSVFALLLVLGLQVGSGLFSDDEILFMGPLASRASSQTVAWMTDYHKDIGQWLLLGLVVLHIAAVLYHLLVRRDNLISAMVSGDKLLPEAEALPASADGIRQRLLAGVLMAVCVGLVAWLVLSAP